MLRPGAAIEAGAGRAERFVKYQPKTVRASIFLNPRGKAMRVAIIGAGVLGASTDLHLALIGAEVVVADQTHTGQATAAGTGIVSP
jgi:NADPH-dependent 2,4-dienoyl-CoA reductase/sulfur reductase-like enzyme